MPVGYYIIPIAEYTEPYPHRAPAYVDEIKCNWTGHSVEELGFYICKVNTTDAKHTDLASRAGVRQLPRNYSWDTLISSLPAVARNAINNWLSQRGLPSAASDETIGDILMRIINSGLFSLGNTPLTTQYKDLTQAQKGKISALCNKWGVAYTDTDTIKDLSRRGGKKWWDGKNLTVTEF